MAKNEQNPAKNEALVEQANSANPRNERKAPGTRVKVMQMAIGLDLIGSKMSMAATRGVELTATSIGIRMQSKTTGRVIVIPYSNVKGFELYPEVED